MSYLITYSGKKVDLLDPSPDSIDIDDIAHALSQITRFNGHHASHFSVADHSLHVLKLMRQRTAKANLLLAALMHDASEAYLGDMSTPLKLLCPDYRAIEARFEAVIAKKYGFDDLSGLEKLALKDCDFIALKTEASDGHYYLALHEGWADDAEAWPYAFGEKSSLVFLQTFQLLK